MTSKNLKKLFSHVPLLAFMSLLFALYFAPKASYADLSVIKRPAQSDSSPHKEPDLAFTPINVNEASAEELVQLKGIGPSKANKIIRYRAKHGPFRRIRDLRRVYGIGKKTLKKLRPFISLKQKKKPPNVLAAKEPKPSGMVAKVPKKEH